MIVCQKPRQTSVNNKNIIYDISKQKCRKTNKNTKEHCKDKDLPILELFTTKGGIILASITACVFSRIERNINYVFQMQRQHIKISLSQTSKT